MRAETEIFRTTILRITLRFDTNVTSSYETAGETSNSFYSQICKISSEEAGRISVEMQDNSSASRLRAMSLKNTTTATAGSNAAGTATDYTTTRLTTEAATGGYMIEMARQATTTGPSWAEPTPQPPLYDVSTIDLSAILDNNDYGDNKSELNTPTMELEEEEVLGEFRVEQPIVLHEGVLTELWNLTPPASKMTKAPSFPSAGKMMCVNPLDVEGRRSGGKKRMAVQQQRQQTAFEVTAKAGPTAAKAKRGQRPKLKLAMPPTVKTEESAPPPSAGAGLTPIIEKTLIDGGSFDLLAYVTDATIKVDDPVAIQHMGLSPAAPSPPAAIEAIEAIKSEPVASTSSSSTSVGVEPSLGKRRRVMTERARAAVKVERKEEEDDEEWQPKPKRRGRPPGKKSMPRGVATAASDHSYDGRAGTGRGGKTSMAAAEDEIKEAKYRRMRDLNNEASKRCRQNRKRKQVRSSLLKFNFRRRRNTIESCRVLIGHLRD